MKIEGKFIFKVAGTLTAISLVVALLLGLTNMLTADKIAAINKQKTEEALAVMRPQPRGARQGRLCGRLRVPARRGDPAGGHRRGQRPGRQAERNV